MYNQISALKVEGVQRFTWEDKKTGLEKSGANLHCSYKDDQISGTGVAKIFVTTDKLDVLGITTGSKINALDRGREGFVFIGKLD